MDWYGISDEQENDLSIKKSIKELSITYCLLYVSAPKAQKLALVYFSILEP